MGSRRRTYTDLVDVVSYTYIFQYKNSSGSWANIGSSTSVNLGTVSASGGSSSISIRHYREKYVNGMFTSNETSDLSYSLPSGVTKTQSGSVSNDYVSIFSYSYGNNTSTSSRTLSMSITCNGNTITASMSQSAGSKSYGSWSSWSVSVSNSGSVSASGGSSTISRSASRYRIWTWNGVAGSGSTEYEYGTPQLSVTSGSGTLSGTTLSYGNNTSTSSRSTRVTGKYSGASDYTDVVQSAGSKQYGSWGAWSISLSASPTTIAAAGGSATITRSATRTRTWTWNGVSGSGGTETGTGTPTLSKVSGNATLSGTTVTYSNNTSTSSRSSVIRATIDSVTKDITVGQLSGSKIYSYGSWEILYKFYKSSSWSPALNPLIIDYNDTNNSSIVQTIYLIIRRTNSYTWNGVSGSGATEYEYDTNNSISYDSSSSDIKDVTFQYTGSTENGYIAMYTVEITGLEMNLAVKFKLSRSVGGKTEFTINNVRKATMIGFIKISNNRFNSADRMTIYKNSEYAGYTYPTSSQYAYIPVLGGESLVIYTTDSLNLNGFTSFAFIMGADTNGSLSDVNAKDAVQTAAKINSYPNLAHTRVSATPHSSTSNYTLICQFTFYLEDDPKKKWNITMSKKI